MRLPLLLTHGGFRTSLEWMADVYKHCCFKLFVFGERNFFEWKLFFLPSIVPIWVLIERGQGNFPLQMVDPPPHWDPRIGTLGGRVCTNHVSIRGCHGMHGLSVVHPCTCAPPLNRLHGLFVTLFVGGVVCCAFFSLCVFVVEPEKPCFPRVPPAKCPL